MGWSQHSVTPTSTLKSKSWGRQPQWWKQPASLHPWDFLFGTCWWGCEGSFINGGVCSCLVQYPELPAIFSAPSWSTASVQFLSSSRNFFPIWVCLPKNWLPQCGEILLTSSKPCYHGAVKATQREKPSVDCQQIAALSRLQHTASHQILRAVLVSQIL